MSDTYKVTPETMNPNLLIGSSEIIKTKPSKLFGDNPTLPTLDALQFWGREANDASIEKAFLHLLYENERIAKKTRKDVLKERARYAGRASKSDGLQILIEELVSKNPTISLKELESILRSDEQSANYSGIILGINDQIIEFKNGSDKSGKDQIKSAQISGLKDRLSRIKKKIAKSKIAR